MQRGVLDKEKHVIYRNILHDCFPRGRTLVVLEGECTA